MKDKLLNTAGMVLVAVLAVCAIGTMDNLPQAIMVTIGLIVSAITYIYDKLH